MNSAWFLQYVSVVVCLAVAAGCICRLDLMTYRDHKSRWQLFYVLLAGFAAWAATDLLHDGQLAVVRAAVVAAELCYLVATSRHWRGRLPQCVSKVPAPASRAGERSHS